MITFEYMGRQVVITYDSVTIDGESSDRMYHDEDNEAEFVKSCINHPQFQWIV